MVRGTAAVLAVYAAAIAYFLLAPALPEIADADMATIAAGSAGLCALALCALALAPAGREPFVLGLVAAGGGLIGAALTVGGVGAAANPAKALLAAALGLLVAHLLATPAVLVAVPLFVAAIDVWSISSGPSSRLLATRPDTVDFLSFDLPAWGNGVGGAQLGLSDIVFLGAFAGLAWRYGLRRAVTSAALALALVASLALGVAFDRAIPALPLLAAALLLPNADRILALLRLEAAGYAHSGMDLEEHTLETAGERCEECGALLTEPELQAALESGGPSLCSIHAAELVPALDEEDTEPEQ